MFTVHLIRSTDDPVPACGAEVVPPIPENFRGTVYLCEACRRYALNSPPTAPITQED